MHVILQLCTKHEPGAARDTCVRYFRKGAQLVTETECRYLSLARVRNTILSRELNSRVASELVPSRRLPVFGSRDEESTHDKALRRISQEVMNDWTHTDDGRRLHTACRSRGRPGRAGSPTKVERFMCARRCLIRKQAQGQ
jgi:hypothetical protein